MRRALVLAGWALLALCVPVSGAATPWKDVRPPAPFTSIAFVNAPGSTRVYARSADHWWRSDDGGATFAATAGSPPYDGDCQLRVSPADPDMLYSGCGSVSDDGGAHWFALPTIEGVPQIDAAGTLYWIDQLNARGTVHRCTPDGFHCGIIQLGDGYGFTVDPASAGVLINFPSSAGMVVSTDGGISWSAPRPLPAGLLSGVVQFDGRAPGKLIAIGQSNYPMRVMSVSADLGLHWGPLRVIPFPLNDPTTPIETTAPSGGIGAQRRTWIQGKHDDAWTSDDGATFHVVHMPVTYGGLTVDPNDGTHLFTGGTERLLESHDAGATWTLRNSSQFGHIADPYARLSGSGSTLYWSVGNDTLFVSADAGFTWTIPRELIDARVTGIVASRDDPRVAYASGSVDNALAFWGTADGGRTWVRRTAPPNPTSNNVGWIEPGHPDWVFMGETGSLPVTASHDGGLTWFSEPIDKMCLFSATIPPDRTHGSASCGPLFAADLSRAPWDQAFDAVQYVQFDRVAGIMAGTSVLGRVNADWSFDAVCAPKFVPGKCSPIVLYSAVRTDAWIAGGAVTYAYYDGTNVWATDLSGHWWLLQPPPGSDPPTGPGALALLSHTRLIANGLLRDLQAPDAGPPGMTIREQSAHCSTPLVPAAADMSWSWRRDGVPIAGATTADRLFAPADRGHALTCVLSASNGWGTSVVASDPYRVPGTAIPQAARLTLTGGAFAGGVLRCGAKAAISWLRDGRAIAKQHGQTYRVRLADEGHSLACQARGAGATPLRSPALRVPKSRGARALAVAVTP